MKWSQKRIGPEGSHHFRSDGSSYSVGNEYSARGRGVNSNQGTRRAYLRPSFSTVGFSTLADSTSDGRTHAIGPISMSAVTLTQFALVLEAFLDASVMVDDAAMGGSFDIELQGTYDNEDALIAALRDQLGLALKFA